jgi:endonuclease/exonuclease/phosphatase family metal-dependent hydrolase
MESSLRVASYNVRDLKDDVDAAARVVRAIDPDVLCLQEVPRHPFSGHRVAGFARRCGLMWSGGHRGSGGTTILTSLRVDVAAARHERLPVARMQRERGYAVTSVALPGHAGVEVASVHLSLDADERARHARAILGSLAPGSPLVVAGDLNEGEDGRAWGVLAERLRPVTEAAPTFTARHPRHRLDVVFAGGPLEVLPHRAVDLDRATLVAATDHLPVWVDLDVRALRRPAGGR